MRTQHYLFHVLSITPKYRFKVCTQWRMSLSPWLLATEHYEAVFLCKSYFMFIGEGVSCRISYSVVSY